MSINILTPAQSPEELLTPAHQHSIAKPQRVLACVLCQQRKVKCDRKFPCGNCTKARVQCISATHNPRQRRRRFPERELLDRLRHYENLLRQNHIQFEPLHTGSMIDENSENSDGKTPKHLGQALSPEAINNDSTTAPKAKSFWRAMSRKGKNPGNDNEHYETEVEDDDDDDSDSSDFLLRGTVVKRAWDVIYTDRSDHLLFCKRDTSVHLSEYHPTQIHIFKLWQIYLENFNPLLKITHTPTLQARIIEAAGDVTNIEPSLEALMFSIYCVAIFSLDQEECRKLFGTPREDLLAAYQLGCREALISCGFLRSGNRDCLTALHLYLMSTKPTTDPRSLSSLLGAAFRVAQRMGIHDESANSKYSPLEAELRRRLWWSMVLYDARISEMTEFRLGLLIPTWDCKQPTNTNDFDLRPEMKTPPEAHTGLSEALFVLVRSDLGNFTRHCSFHLDFINPALKSVAHPISLGLNSEAPDELDTLELQLEQKYLRHCDAQNPLHYMTIWWARGQLAKNRFVKLLSICSNTAHRTDAHRDLTISHALTMLECDTKLMASSSIKGFRWLIYLNFPFPAYVHITEDLRKRPLSAHADRAWQVMSDNASGRFRDMENRGNLTTTKDSPFFKIFSKVLHSAWSARESAVAQLGSGTVESPPLIITQVRAKLGILDPKAHDDASSHHDAGVNLDNLDPSLPMHMDSNVSYGMGENFMNMDNGDFSFYQQQGSAGVESYNWGWPMTSLHPPMLGHGW